MSKPRYKPLTSQVTLIVLALAAFTLAMVAAFGTFATLSTDRGSLEKQKTFVATGIADEIAELVREQASVTVWDAALLASRGGDQRWLEENLGAWLHEYYGIDRVYVIDAAGRPVHAMRDGETVEPAAFEDDRQSVAPWVAELRALARERAGVTEAEPPVVSGLVSFDGRPAMLAAQPIVPDTDRVALEAGEDYVHIAVQFVDATVVDRIADKYLLTGAHLLPQSAAGLPQATVPLSDAHGAILGHIAWEEDRPGTALVLRSSPALVAGGLLAAGVLWFLLRHLRRAAGELQRSQDQAQYLAFHDTLTGLPNRALFEDRLKRALQAVARDNRRVGLIYMDLDRFKTINDTLGHPAGDELVRQTAGRLEKSIRHVDTVARLGGDEFAIIVFDVKDVATAQDLCQRLLAEIGKPFDLLGDQVFVGASIGLAISSGADTDPGDLLRKADIALYEAKKNGRGRYEVFAGDMDDLLTRKRMIESDLRAALSGGGGMKLVYQPVFGANGRTMLGVEALIRWDHPLHGVLSPAHFVSIADERGMTNLLGDWVLGEVVDFAARADLPWVAVNVSPLQLRDTAYVERTLGVLSEAGVSPRRIQMEIVESALIENSSDTMTVLSALREAGIRVALDDFGTGYSSIGYLQRRMVDKLKIDRSFVRMLGGSEGNAIVKAIIDLAAALNVTVTAEGVETEQQRDLLLAMGCDEMQGFLLSPALEARDLVRLPPAARGPLRDLTG
ncbi:putative bifunctional diguanylate cyclase/phosphodiesterase [Mesorhizobium marinum]|uniref:putative bifunctional diguanylate cyclase/phosphodiesterase n=1 Tax=Mesorhizobium marinum TaxID=3228790 RepID=UPI003465C8E6